MENKGQDILKLIVKFLDLYGVDKKTNEIILEGNKSKATVRTGEFLD